MLHTVKKVEYFEDYKLKLTFDDKTVRLVDFEERLKDAKNMFLPLKDVNYFKKVKTDGTTLVWPNGLDLCPDVLHEKGIEITKKATPVHNRTRRKVSSTSKPRKLPRRIAAKSK